MSDLIPRRHRALTIALVYALIGAVWILLSDRFVDLMSRDSEVVTRLQTWKGWAYVATTALLIYVLVRRALEAQAKEAARRQEAEDLTRLVLDTIPGMIIWKDRQSRYLGGNKVALREAGLSRSVELVGLTDADLPWKAHADLLRKHDEEILSGRAERLDYEIIIATASGRQRDQSVTKLPLKSSSGEIRGVMVYSEDLTERRQTERQLRHAQKLQVIGELTSGVTHDFKNVLSVIIANAEWIANTLPASESEARTATADILAVSRNAAGMVRKLLAFSRQDAVSIESFDLAERIRTAIPMFERMLSPAYQLKVEFPEVSPAVLADPAALEQITLNIVTNARDAMPTGGIISLRVLAPQTRAAILDSDPQARIVLSAEHASPEARFVGVVISDSGPGMPPEIAERIFEPYFSTRVGGTGTGLGLSMVHGLVHQHGGLLTLQTAPGQGATFGFYLPVDVTTTLPRSATLPITVAPAAAEPSGKTILLVDDQPELRRVGSRVLRRLGYQVLEAAGGEEALEIFSREEQRINLILTDLVMPEMNGLELLARIRSQGSTVPIALSSGDPNLAEKAGAADYGTIPMITKPWTMQDLADGVRALLGDTPP